MDISNSQAALRHEDQASIQTPAPNLRSRIASAVAMARTHAEAVDRDGRFPKEAFAELRAQRLLGLLLPLAAGGEAASISDVAQICYALGRACSSTALIFAMHQASLACLTRHADANPKFAGYLKRIGDGQLLVASSTTEGQNGANLRSSASPIVWEEDHISLNRDASVVSYGSEADAIISTARKSANSVPTDQVLVLLFKDQYRLSRTIEWNALGMRGTCSDGFILEATGEREQVMSEAYERIHRCSMLPVSHLLWSAGWAGIAAGAVERAQLFIRKVMRASKGNLPPGAPCATQAYQSLMTLTRLIDSALSDFARRDESALEDMSFQTSLNLLKVSASELSIAAVLNAFYACGIAGYRNDTEFSIGRALRDILSTSVMINNNRILSNMGPSTLLIGVPEQLSRH